MSTQDHLAARRARQVAVKVAQHGLEHGGEYSYWSERDGEQVSVRCRTYLQGAPRLSWVVVDLDERGRELPETERPVTDGLLAQLFY